MGHDGGEITISSDGSISENLNASPSESNYVSLIMSVIEVNRVVRPVICISSGEKHSDGQRRNREGLTSLLPGRY